MIVILEGADGVGKSTVAKMLNEQLPFSYLLKLTGAPKHVQTQDWVKRTYDSIIPFLIACGNKSHIIVDRAWPSEAVYAPLFKEYKPDYIDNLVDAIHSLAPTHYVFMYASPETLAFRMQVKIDSRPYEKHQDIKAIEKIQESYKQWFAKLKAGYPNNVHDVDVTNMRAVEVVDWIMKELDIVPKEVETSYSFLREE